jgi:16S rRNA C967 or C1407 C5-methylase (RsmB/RsmF family)
MENNNEDNNNNLVFDSRAALEDMASRGGKRKRMNKSARGRERKRLRQLASEEDWLVMSKETTTSDDPIGTPKIKPFDHVLVDAECSTDGSLKHMKERIKEGSKEETNLMLTDQKQLSDLVDLQKRLIASGFRLLKQGGTMVYSTCSLSQDQNENVVQWLLNENKDDAYLIPVHFPLANSSTKLVAEGSLEGTVRFYPNVGQQSADFFGDGLFLAKIGKNLKEERGTGGQ